MRIDVVGCVGIRSGVVLLSLRAQAARFLGYGWSRTVQEVIQFYIKTAFGSYNRYYVDYSRHGFTLKRGDSPFMATARHELLPLGNSMP